MYLVIKICTDRLSTDAEFMFTVSALEQCVQNRYQPTKGQSDQVLWMVQTWHQSTIGNHNACAPIKSQLLVVSAIVLLIIWTRACTPHPQTKLQRQNCKLSSIWDLQSQFGDESQAVICWFRWNGKLWLLAEMLIDYVECMNIELIHVAPKCSMALHLNRLLF